MYFAGPPIWLLLAVPYMMAVLVFLILWTIDKRRLAHRSKELPSCRRCGYPVVGLSQPICPECGGTLATRREIVRPDVTGIRTAARRMAIFTFIISYPAIVAGIVFAKVPIWPRECSASKFVFLREPESRAYFGASIQVSAIGNGDNYREGEAHLQFELLAPSPGAQVRDTPIQIDIATGRWRDYLPRTPANWSDRAIDADMLVTQMNARGVVGDPDALRREAQGVLKTIEILGSGATGGPTMTDPFGQVTFGANQLAYENPWWAAWVIAAIESYAWFVVARLIWRRARRQALQRAVAIETVTAAARLSNSTMRAD